VAGSRIQAFGSGPSPGLKAPGEAIGASLSPREQPKLDVVRAAIQDDMDGRTADTAWREACDLPVDGLILSALAMLEEISAGEAGRGSP
jgi:hypothetical protein